MNYSLLSSLQYILNKETGDRPASGTIYAIDGTRIDVQVANSIIIRNIPFVGDMSRLRPGQSISLQWEGSRAVGIAISAATGSTGIQVNIQADNDTLEVSPLGIRVRQGGIQPWHLGFVPSMEGHTHEDLFMAAGWRTDGDHAIYQNNMYLHPGGAITLGNGTNILKLDASHSTHRLWAGASVPADANFAITNEGAMYAADGVIAGWNIAADSLSKNGITLNASGEIIAGSGNNIAILSAVNPDGWRFWIGDVNPALAPFRVDEGGNVWLESANVSVDLTSSNYVPDVSGWKMDPSGWAEFNNIQVRGKVSSLVFERTTVSVISGRQMVTDGAVLVSDVGELDETIEVDIDTFIKDDFLQMTAGGRNEWMLVTGVGIHRHPVLRLPAMD